MSDLLNATHTKPSARIPAAALIPGLLGLLPFWGLALSTELSSGLDPLLALMALIMYGAIILSFVGALWWGMAVHAAPSAPRAAMFVWSVVPALIGWAAIMTEPTVGLRMLIGGLALQWILDGLLMRNVPNLIPHWVFKLRTLLTLGATSALGFTWWQLSL
jgi:hypothetical protein